MAPPGAGNDAGDDAGNAAACLLAAADAPAGEMRAPSLWIDVRRTADVRRQPLRGVLEIPLAELPGKVFLQRERLVLVGDGFDGERLLQACQQLRAAGWRDVRVLDGGVWRWHAARPRDDGGATPSLDEISAAQWVQAMAHPGWRFVSVGLDEAALAKMPRRPAVALPADAHAPERLAEAVDALLRAQPAGSKAFAGIVVLTPDPMAAQRLRRELPLSGKTDGLLWLKGGWVALQEYLEQQQRITFAAGRPLTRPCGAL